MQKNNPHTLSLLSGEVITAIPIPDETVAMIEKELCKAIGMDVSLKKSVDKSLIGGVIVRLGEKTIDGSIRGQLERVREEIAKGGR